MSRLWKQLPTRARIMLLLAVVLTVALLLRHVRLPTDSLPLPGNIQKLERDLVRSRRQLDKVRALKQQREKTLAELRAQAAPFWMVDDKAAATEVQTEFQKIARQAQVRISTVGAPSTNTLFDLTHIREVEFAIRITASMREISRLLAEVENSPHRFFWSSCSIRPDNRLSPQRVVLNGKVKALVLSREAAEFLTGAREAERPVKEVKKRNG